MKIKLKYIWRFSISALAVTVIMLTSWPTALAQESEGVSLTTSPLPTSLRADPGTTVKTDLKVQNSGKTPITLKVSLLKFAANNEQGQPKLADKEADDDYFNWVSFSEDRFVAEPSVWKSITMTINVPANAGLGYYYAVVFTRDDGSKPQDKQTAIQGAAAILVLLNVASPNEKRQLELVSFTSEHKVYEFLPAKFTVKLKNNGNIFIAPSGTVFINKGSNQLASIPMNPGRGNILPGTTRSYTVYWDDGFPAYKEKIENGKQVTDKNNVVIRELKWDFNSPLAKFRFGRFTAKVVAAYDVNNRDVPLEGTVTFWVIPWRFLLVLLVLILLLGFMIYRYIRMRRRLKQLISEKNHQTKETSNPKNTKKTNEAPKEHKDHDAHNSTKD